MGVYIFLSAPHAWLSESTAALEKTVWMVSLLFLSRKSTRDRMKLSAFTMPSYPSPRPETIEGRHADDVASSKSSFFASLLVVRRSA
jgi:hypothetical protein